MPEEIDIQKVIQAGTRQMNLQDLAKMGHQRVRVIDEARINELIAQAVRQTISRETAGDTTRRQAAEQEKSQIEAQLLQYRARIEKQTVEDRDVNKLRGDVAALQARLKEADGRVEAEKRRIAEESRREFQKLLGETRAEQEAKSGVSPGALMELVKRSDELLSAEDRAALPAQDIGAAGAAKVPELLEALARRIDVLGRVATGAYAEISQRDQDIAVAAAERRRQEAEFSHLRGEIERLKDVVRERERDVEAREQDVLLAARDQHRLVDENKRLREEAARAAGLENELERLKSERQFLLTRVEESSKREGQSEGQLAGLSDKLSELYSASKSRDAEIHQSLGEMKGVIGEEIARQVAWALQAHKTGVGAIDPEMQLDALFSQKVETNIESIKIEERSGDTVADKLAKLRQATKAKKT